MLNQNKWTVPILFIIGFIGSVSSASSGDFNSELSSAIRETSEDSKKYTNDKDFAIDAMMIAYCRKSGLSDQQTEQLLSEGFVWGSRATINDVLVVAKAVREGMPFSLAMKKGREKQKIVIQKAIVAADQALEDAKKNHEEAILDFEEKLRKIDQLNKM